MVLASAAATLLLAGCAGGYDSEDHRDGQPWRITRVGSETDYELLDAVVFRNDSAELSEHAIRVIADLAGEARQHPGSPIVVDGYTDTTGTHEHNIDLSEARAKSVAAALMREGVNGRRIETHGFGETHLAVATANDVSERRNRRVVIRILAPV